MSFALLITHFVIHPILAKISKLIYSFNHFAIFLNISECITDSDCPDHLECGVNGECADPPCPKCGANAHCEGSNHTGICVCKSGYPAGDPYLDCFGK